MKVLFALSLAGNAVIHIFRHNHTANVCGHLTKQKGVMKSPDGSQSIMSMPLADNGHPNYCLECIGKMTIQCAWCDNRIAIGDPVTLYIPKKGFEIPKHAVHYSSEGGQESLVGCLGWNCAESSADLCGRWMPPGVVQRVPSPIELCLHGMDGKGPNVVFVGDTHNYPASVSLHRIG